MMRRLIAGLLLWACLPWQIAGADHRDYTPFVVSGVISNSSSAQAIREFVDYLNRQTGMKLKIHFADNYSRLSTIMRRDSRSIGWTCGAPYVEDARRDQQQLVSVPLLNQQPLYHSLIITATGRPEKRLLDFKGKIFAYSDHRSNSGYLVPAVQLKKQGVEMENFFSLMINTGNHENSIVALLNGLADVAAIDEYVWIEYSRKHPQVMKRLHEIQRFGPFPFTPIVAARDVSDEEIKRLRQVLVSMNKDPEGKRILQKLGMDGFVNRPDDFYRPIRDMLQQMNTGDNS